VEWSGKRAAIGFSIAIAALATRPLPGQIGTSGSQFWTQESAGFLETAQHGAQLGATLAAGDFDGDGYDDLAVGAPWYDYVSTPSVPDNGAVFVLRGGPNGLQTAVGHSRQLVLLTRFGAALAAGDFDGDGIDDLAVGAPEATVAGVAGAGAVWVAAGGASGFELPGTTLDADIYASPQLGAQFGFALATGDFDGDGYDDLAVGEPSWDGTGADRGRLAIFAGSAAGLDTSGTWSVKSEPFAEVADDARFGAALAVGDFDGNGFDDLAVGAPEADDQSEGPCNPCDIGRVATYYSTGAALFTDQLFGLQDLVGGYDPRPADRFGLSLAAGDANGDGYDDLLVGFPHWDGDAAPFTSDMGESVAVRGSAGGIAVAGGVERRNSTAYGLAIASNQRVGTAVALVDFDGDGAATAVAGGPGVAVGGSGRGWVGVVPGPFPSALAFTQDSAGVGDVAEDGDSFGQTLAAGDFDGDCRLDLAVGVPFEDVVPGQLNEGGFHVFYARGLPFRDDFERGDLRCWGNF